MNRMKKDIYIKKLIELKVAGKGVGHSRAHNIRVIEGIKSGDEHSTLGIDSLITLESGELLKAIASITGCSKDISYIEGEGYIDPEATLEGLEKAAIVIAKKCKEKKNIVLATGHPGSMLGFYLEVEKTIRKMGGNILSIPQGVLVEEDKYSHFEFYKMMGELDSISDIAVESDGNCLLHTHGTKLMEIIIEKMKKENISIDLVIGDHGFAGRALTEGMDVIAVMDTNDPALAAAKLVGYDLTIIPMDDNRPNYISKKVGKILSELIYSA